MPTFYSTNADINMSISKLIKMNDDQALALAKDNGDTIPPQRLLSGNQRAIPYNDLNMHSLEYLWFGSKKATFATRMVAKAVYMTKLNPTTNPRKNKLFSLEENNTVTSISETEMLKTLDQVETIEQEDGEPAKGW